MQPGSAYDQEARELSLPSCANQNLTCQLLVVGGGLSGLSATEAAHKLGLDVIVIEKGTLGKAAASGLNAGQFLTGWAKSVDAMLAELTQQEQQRGAAGDQARIRAERRVRAFLRRTVEGCQRLARLDHEYNLRASVRHGAVMAGLDEADMASLRATYGFMEGGNFRALMPTVRGRRPPFFEFLSARELQRRYGSADGLYVGGVVDHFGGSFRPRKFLIGLARSLQKRGVRFFQHTEAQALDFPGPPVTVFCGNGATIRANAVFMANAYARHINGEVLERTIFEYDYVVDLELPEGAKVLASGNVLSDMREPCFYARRHGRSLYVGYEETAESSPDITREVAGRTLEEAKRVFPALRDVGEGHIKGAWCGLVYYTLDDYPFVERQHGGRVITFAAPSDHGNAMAIRVGELVGGLAALSAMPSTGADGARRRRRVAQQLRLFEDFPKGLRLRPGRRYQQAAQSDDPPS